MAFPGCKSPITACAENLSRAVDAWEPIAVGFSAQFYVGDDEESGVGRSPVAKQVFSDTTRSATRRTIASTPRHATLSVSVTEFSAVWAYTPYFRTLTLEGLINDKSGSANSAKVILERHLHQIVVERFLLSQVRGL